MSDAERITKLEAELVRWKKALYSVTPGIGSECIDDPEFCAARIRDTRQTLMNQLVKKVEKIHDLEQAATRRS